MGATTTLNREPALRQQNAFTVPKVRGPLTQVEVHYMHRKMGRHQVEITLEEGHKSTKSNHMEHPMVKGDSPPIQRTDEGRIHSCISTLDGDLRAKRMASKHLCTKYYTTLLLRMAHAVSTPYNTILQPLYEKRPAIRQSGYKQYHPNALYKQGAICSSKMAYRPKSPLAVLSSI